MPRCFQAAVHPCSLGRLALGSWLLPAVWMAIGTSSAWGQCLEEQKLTALDVAVGDLFGTSVSVDGDTAVVGAYLHNGAVSRSGSAYVFVRAGGVWTLQQELTPSDAAMNDGFGRSVSISGNTVVVGADFDDDAGSASGSAYVFVRSGVVWTQQQKLTASDAAGLDRFGSSVSVNGNTAIVGASYDDHAGGSDAGSAYVFVRSGVVWTQQQKLTASDAAASDTFGTSVSVDGDTAIVGASHDAHAGGTDAGSAYVFVRSGVVWTQQQKLTASDAAASDRFGTSVSVDGDTAVVGSILSGSGAAYVYTRGGAVWTQEQKLIASDASGEARFGTSVSVSGDMAVIGAIGDSGEAPASGSAYVFVRCCGVWNQQQKLTASGEGPFGLFGSSVSASGGTILVGAPSNVDFIDTVPGSAYAFACIESCFQEQKQTASDAAGDDQYGKSVAVSSDTAVVGAPFDDLSGGATNAGSAYVLARSDGVWAQQQKLTASDFAADDNFGRSVGVSADTVVVGAYLDDHAGGVDAGAAYVFVRSGTVWTQQQKLTASDAAAGDRFGRSVSVSGNTVVIGADFDDDAGSSSGSAYVFVRSGVVWTQQQKLTASDAAAGDQFGSSVSASGNTVFVGAHFNDDAGSNSGSAYAFVRSGTVWTQQQKLTAFDAATGDEFGESVAVNQEFAVVGAPGNDDAGADSGSAYVFTRSGVVWSVQPKLTALDAAAGDEFGNSVAIRNDGTVVVGAHFDDDAGSESGAAYAFHLVGGGWTQYAKLTASDGAAADVFGGSVAVSGENFVVGADSDDDGGPASGSVYLFTCAPPPYEQPPMKGTDDKCVGGPAAGLGCAQNSDCPSGFCQLKNRFITAATPPTATAHGLKVMLVNIDSNSVATPANYNGTDRWVGTPTLGVPDGVSGVFNAAKIQCVFQSTDWSTVGRLHTYGDVIVPQSTYDVSVCALDVGPCSPALRIATAKFGDAVTPVNTTNFQDVNSIVAKFQGAPSGPSKTRTKLTNSIVNPANPINFQEVSACVSAFQGKAFKLVVPAPPIICP